jgi:hypothetical protein
LIKAIDIDASPLEVFNFLIDFYKMHRHMKASPMPNNLAGYKGMGATAHFVGKHGGSTTEWDMEITSLWSTSCLTLLSEK